MGKYGEAIGIWELKIGGADLKLRPKKGDNLELMNLLRKNKNNEEKFSEGLYTYLYGLISREVPPVDDKEKEELSEFVEFNLMKLFEEMMIAFRWTTKAEIEKQFGGESKKS